MREFVNEEEFLEWKSQNQEKIHWSQQTKTGIIVSTYNECQKKQQPEIISEIKDHVILTYINNSPFYMGDKKGTFAYQTAKRYTKQQAIEKSKKATSKGIYQWTIKKLP